MIYLSFFVFFVSICFSLRVKSVSIDMKALQCLHFILSVKTNPLLCFKVIESLRRLTLYKHFLLWATLNFFIMGRQVQPTSLLTFLNLLSSHLLGPYYSFLSKRSQLKVKLKNIFFLPFPVLDNSIIIIQISYGLIL